jgi:hypothetical protein
MIFIDILKTNFNNISMFSFLNYFKTGNHAMDAILSSIIISIFSYILNYIYDYRIDKIFININFDTIKSFFYTKNTIIIEGKNCATTSIYTSTYSVCSLYSQRFKAIIGYIIENIENIENINEIKETHSNIQSSEVGQGKRKCLDIFMVYQAKHFKIDDNIFIQVERDQEECTTEKDKVNSKVDKITIKIYSYFYSIGYLIKYVDNITEQYLAAIKEHRYNKRYIYFLEKCKIENEESRYDCWKEEVFESVKTFNNIFFDGKKELIEKIDYFINNRNWYYDKGVPYTLGIGLSGPPGTGKTSFIKALANYTNRHLITISLKTIKTKRQLEHFFFENTYNENNEKNSITFDKKIIVFEDIDCIGDIVLDRNKKIQNNKNSIKTLKNNVNIGDVIQSIYGISNENEIKIPTVTNISNLNNEPPVTLDDILNLWDGIRETPGRILIITSNYYNTLDSALIRPGRIDITHEFSNASHETISEIYTHLFNKEIENNKLLKIKEYSYSPAELINIYVSNKNENEFVKKLIKNNKNKNYKIHS